MARVDFEDGSHCSCGAPCAQLEGGCCIGAESAACVDADPLDAWGELLPPCPQHDADGMSLPGGEPLVVTWVNRATHPITLSVLDYPGRERGRVTLSRCERGCGASAACVVSERRGVSAVERAP